MTRSQPGLALITLAAAAAAVAAVPAAAAAATASPVVGHVYVDDNTAGTNTIGAFDRHADGTLTPEAGSPFTAGGAGTGTGLASQGALQISAHGRFLIAADAGSNQVSVLRIKVGSNYTGFRLGRGGRLTPIPGSTVVLPDAAQPGDVLFNGTGGKLAGTRVGTSQIDSFTVGPRGRLTAAPGSPFPAQGLGPFGSQFRPTNPSQLFVSNAHNTGTGTISAFRDLPDGSLSPIGASPFADLQTAPCWVEITHDGQFLFTVNTGSGSISRFSIAPGGKLRLLGSTPIRGSGLGAVDARLSPDGRNLYADESATGAVAAFTVHGGNLTELASSPTPLPAGATPAGIVVT
jgi:hypothetical protein